MTYKNAVGRDIKLNTAICEVNTRCGSVWGTLEKQFTKGVKSSVPWVTVYYFRRRNGQRMTKLILGLARREKYRPASYYTDLRRMTYHFATMQPDNDVNFAFK